MKNHKKYFKINLLLIFLGIVLIYVLSFVNRHYNHESNKFLRVPNNLEIVNLGSSHGQLSFRYPKNTKSFNLALSAQPLYYDAKILKKYSKNIKENGVVIIPVSLFSLYQNNEEFKKWDDRYYYFLNWNNIYNGNRRDGFLAENLSLLLNGKALKGTIKTIFTSIKNRKMIYRDFEYNKTLNLEEKTKIADSKANDHQGITGKNQNPEIALAYLEDILNTCKENGFQPVLVTTPLTYLYNERVIDGKWDERVYSHIRELKEKYDFEYLDYSHDDRFENNLELFLDTDHLNEKGADKFTEIILKDLKDKKILNNNIGS